MNKNDFKKLTFEDLKGTRDLIELDNFLKDEDFYLQVNKDGDLDFFYKNLETADPKITIYPTALNNLIRFGICFVLKVRQEELRRMIEEEEF